MKLWTPGHRIDKNKLIKNKSCGEIIGWLDWIYACIYS